MKISVLKTGGRGFGIRRPWRSERVWRIRIWDRLFVVSL